MKTYTVTISGNITITLKGKSQEDAESRIEKQLEADNSLPEYNALEAEIGREKLDALGQLENYEVEAWEAEE